MNYYIEGVTSRIKRVSNHKELGILILLAFIIVIIIISASPRVNTAT